MVDARHLDKSPDAFRTISEVADDLELPQHVLRFWETRFTHIRPVKRAGGRRYYRPDDVELLRGIRHLLYSEGYTIKGVQKILKDHGVRHVQAIGYDDGESMQPAPVRPAAPPPAPASDEGGGFGGLLGLLPRRRPRSEATDLGVPSAYDEPPLPFPDFASFTPRSEDVPEPPPRASAARPAAAKAPPRQAAPAQRAEPVFDADEDEEDPYRPAPMRQDPSFDAAPPRRPVVPPQRPSRGPASRLPEPPAARELEDPLLPFFDDELPPAEQISEPLDARIRRMKDNAPPAPPPQPGPPEEYIPARARKRAAPADRAPYREAAPEPRRQDPQDPRDYAPRGRTDIDDELAGQGDLYADADTDWRRPMRGAGAARPADDFAADDFEDDDRFAPPRMPRPRGPVSDAPSRGRESEPYMEPPRAAQPRDRMPPAHEPEWGPPPAAPAGRGRLDRPAERSYGGAPLPPLSGQRSARDPFFDPPPPVQAPLVAPPRLGPFLGPMEEYDPDEPETHATYRAELGDRRAAERHMEREPRRGSRDERDYAPEPNREPRSRGRDGWDEDEDEAMPARVHRESGEGWREPPDDYLPPEPLRPGPPEQYLPPHLRSEPRMTGAPTPPAPVLSRDDISRLQATLYELTECRRLMAAVLAGEAPDTEGA